MSTEPHNIITLLNDPATRFTALALLVQARRQAVSMKLDGQSYFDQEGKLFRSLCETPIHPVLLATAMANCIVSQADMETIIEHYCEGALISELEDRYILYGHTGTEINIDQTLEVEASLLEDMMLLSLHRLSSISNGPFIYFRHVLKSTKEGNPPEGLSMHKIRRATWYEFNPTLSVVLPPIKRDAILYNYGFHWNSKFHNAREYFADKLGEAKSAINIALAGNESADTLNRLKHQYALCVNLRDRANQFYRWNPCEIDAHDFGETAAAAVKKMYGSENEDAVKFD